MARSDLLQSYARFQKALNDYNNLIAQIEDKAASIKEQYNVNATEIQIMNHNLLTQVTLDATIVAARVAAYAFDRAAKSAQDEADATAEGLPKVTGLASDVTSGMRAALKHAGSTAAEVFEVSADVARGTELVAQQAKEVASLQSQIEISAKEKKEALGNELSMLAVLVRLRKRCNSSSVVMTLPWQAGFDCLMIAYNSGRRPLLGFNSTATRTWPSEFSGMMRSRNTGPSSIWRRCIFTSRRAPMIMKPV